MLISSGARAAYSSAAREALARWPHVHLPSVLEVVHAGIVPCVRCVCARAHVHFGLEGGTCRRDVQRSPGAGCTALMPCMQTHLLPGP